MTLKFFRFLQFFLVCYNLERRISLAKFDMKKKYFSEAVTVNDKLF